MGQSNANAMRVLVVGAGSISREYALHHFNPSSTNTVVVGIVDLNEEKAIDLATQVGSAQAGAVVRNDDNNKYKARVLSTSKGTPVPHFTDIKVALETLSDSIDIVYIGTTPKSHRRLVEESFQHGKHVLLEKPLAANIEDADAIIAAAATSNCILAMDIGMRYNPALQELRNRVLFQNELGKPQKLRASLKMHYQQWPREWQTQPWCASREEGGPLREVGTHFFSALLEFVGAHHYEKDCPATRPSVRAKVRATVDYPNHDGACETSASGVIAFEGGDLPPEGLHVEFSVVTDAPGDMYELTITPDESSNSNNKSLTLFDFVSLRNQNGKVFVRDASYGRKECVQALVAATIGSENETAPSVVTAQHGRNAQRILDAVVNSKGDYVAIDFDR
eukprot:CAMPEP_0178900122 /NCGR_PEP_ID=MMETSP0786-20121207/3296_1 /TAXON_ID=186022 /ORGANISM="Thalassionema frauenfeldii, Strain CCMP 1798" /LENGTH=392 /DNA_ID=CAMNT_0020571087 /DNA_START=104 /DNA_END=1282 /DNA_ORIENTATION=-